MSELRAPDPTLDALDGGEPLLLDVAPDLPAAHLPGRDEGPRCSAAIGQYDEMLVIAEFACWFAVPCRECFPDATDPGYVDNHEFGEVRDEHLSWQVSS